MITDDNKLVIIFNGEIYNHIEIRKQLEKDHKIIFKSNSDTETLLYGWYFFTVKDIIKTKWNFLILHL